MVNPHPAEAPPPPPRDPLSCDDPPINKLPEFKRGYDLYSSTKGLLFDPETGALLSAPFWFGASGPWKG